MIDIPRLEAVKAADPAGLENLTYPPPATVVVTLMEAETPDPPDFLGPPVAVGLAALLTKTAETGDLPMVVDTGQIAETQIIILQALLSIITLAQIGEIGIGKEIANSQIKEMIRTKGEAEVSTINLGRAIMVVVAQI